MGAAMSTIGVLCPRCDEIVPVESGCIRDGEVREVVCPHCGHTFRIQFYIDVGYAQEGGNDGIGVREA